jgi:hypothetical protein
MIETIISLETAKLVKEKGFYLQVTSFYNKNGTLGVCSIQSGFFDSEYRAPTQSLLQKWLREVHHINVESNYLPNIKKYGCLYIPMGGKSKRSDVNFVDKKYYDTYEDALEIGLQKGLNLIYNEKLEMDMDLRIIGFNYGNKGTKNENVISVLQLESEDGLLKTSPGGMTEAMMVDITERQEELLGTIVQIRCCGLSQTDKGWSTQHPSIVELRSDKNTCDTLESCIGIQEMAKTLSAK